MGMRARVKLRRRNFLKTTSWFRLQKLTGLKM